MNTSDKIKKRLVEAGDRFWAGDNISAHIEEGEKQQLIDELAVKFEDVLQGLVIDTENDPNSNGTGKRLAKMYINELMSGRYEAMPVATAFPNDSIDRYEGMLVVRSELTSMCSHHHQRIGGRVSIAYVPSKDGKVIGLSKLNRIVDLFGRRGAIQEQLTVAIHNAINKICEGNIGVAVMIDATHNCVSCRGVKHQGASMQTAKLSGCFLEEADARAEFYKNIELASICKH